MSKGSKRSSGQSKVPATRPPPTEVEADEVAGGLAKSLEILFTGYKIPEGADLTDRRLRLTLQRAALQHHRGATALADTLTESIGKQVDADNEDRDKRREAEIEDRDKRREAELEEERKRREGEEEREDKRLAQELKECETNREDGSRERNLFMWLTAVCVVATVVFAVLTAKYSEPWGYAGMGTGLALSGIMYRLRALAPLPKSRGEEKHRRGKRKERRKGEKG